MPKKTRSHTTDTYYNVMEGGKWVVKFRKLHPVAEGQNILTNW